jgi:ribosome-binding factor A
MIHRSERVANLIKEELSKIISREIEFPGCLMTITGVDVDAKLEKAIVNFSVLPSEKFEEVLKILEKNRRHLQYLLMKKINIKPMPEIEFRIDRGPEKAAEIEKILLEDKMKK